MGTLSGFRPPQFSEDDAWVPAWLQQCNFKRLNVDEIKKDHITFEQRVEELQFLQTGISDGESLREDGGCNIGRLFISGTDSSPFSFARSADNVVQFHLCLSLDGNSENSNLTTDARQTEPKCPSVTQPIEKLRNSGQDGVKLSLFGNAGAVDMCPTAELLKLDEDVDFAEASDDAVELCIAASEALAINEVVDGDSFAKSSSALAILEASLQVKQARLEVWKNNLSGSIDVISEIDNLSDLDDIIMGSAYEDTGIHFDQLLGNELSVSQVKDTFDSANVSGKSCDDRYTHEIETAIDDDTQFKADISVECSDGDKQNRVIDNAVCDLGTDLAYHRDCLKTVDTQAKLHPSILAEKVNATTPEKNSHETNMRSSPVAICRDRGKHHTLPSTVPERFESRWFGGWTSNNEVRHTTVKYNIPKPFAGETSFLSESADAAPDENSFVQNHDRGATIASQLSVHTENFCNGGNDGMLLSQDEKSSSASLVDPLCSVVPCSIAENVCSSPAIRHEDRVQLNCKKDDVLRTSFSNDVQGERVAPPIANIKESCNGVSRRFTSLRYYSKLMPSRAEFLQENVHQRKSFLIDSNTESTFKEAPFTNREETMKVVAELSIKDLAEESPIRTSVTENKSKRLPIDNLHRTLLQRKSRNAQKLPTSKRVHFYENEIIMPDNKKLRKVQTASKTCYSTRASKRSSGSSAYPKYRAQQMDREKKRLIFQTMEFLLTGFSPQKEKEIECLVRKYGGIVISQLPFINLKGKRSSRSKSPVLPIVLCLKKTQSFKFLYGCAVNAYILKVNWLIDSIAAGLVLPPKEYMILPINNGGRDDQVYTAINYNIHSLVFNKLGIMLHGKTKYVTNIATIIKHGGGQVFKTLQRLVQALEAGRISKGVVVADEGSCASRHLKHCTLEQNIPMTPVSWIIKSLYAGHLIALETKKISRYPPLPAIKLQRRQDSIELSQEI
ncbi:hypothetical protein ABFS83_02G108900 [Erythranthe nasuta]